MSLPTFRRSVLPPWSGRRVRAGWVSHQSTRRYNPEDSHLHAHRRENLRSKCQWNYGSDIFKYDYEVCLLFVGVWRKQKKYWCVQEVAVTQGLKLNKYPAFSGNWRLISISPLDRITTHSTFSHTIRFRYTLILLFHLLRGLPNNSSPKTSRPRFCTHFSWP
jgi:hypothetical protein